MALHEPHLNHPYHGQGPDDSRAAAHVEAVIGGELLECRQRHLRVVTEGHTLKPPIPLLKCFRTCERSSWGKSSLSKDGALRPKVVFFLRRVIDKA